ncbi:hypothetical protein [Kitasatospora sp. NPDC059571]|uniref:hypothetical protein n=1 Tax=Kitasatospora sp. NPDC059571 TaxID=3346871 RepID=UPI0036849B85
MTPDRAPGQTRTPYEIANAVGEEIRILNHRTAEGSIAYPDPASVHDVITALHAILFHLPQALGQAAAGLAAIPADRMRVALPDGDLDTPSVRQARVSEELARAAETLELARAHVASASAFTSGLDRFAAVEEDDPLDGLVSVYQD